MEKICKAHIECVSEDLASNLIALASSELTLTADVVPDWQNAASKLLSTLGIRFAQLVMKELLIKFQPGGNPHYFVVYTLGLLATANGDPPNLRNDYDANLFMLHMYSSRGCAIVGNGA